MIGATRQASGFTVCGGQTGLCARSPVALSAAGGETCLAMLPPAYATPLATLDRAYNAMEGVMAGLTSRWGRPWGIVV
jgi:hypothetical protein